MKKVNACLIGVLMLTTIGCATMQSTKGRLITWYAVSKMFSKNPQWAEPAHRIMVDSLTYVKNGTVTLNMLEKYIRGQIDFTKLDRPDQILLESVIAVSREELERAFRAQDIEDPAKMLVEIVPFLEMVRDEATYYFKE